MSLAIHIHPSTSASASAGAVCEGIPDSTSFAAQASRGTRYLMLAVALAGGVVIEATARHHAMTDTLMPVLLGMLFFAGGLLSTWSPCGYSCLSLLRPVGDRYRARAVLGYLPTLGVHAAGYALGALVLGGLLGAVGVWLLPAVPRQALLWLLGAMGLAYGLHQLGFLRVPYPQRRAQVPHDARYRFPMWVIGLLYGFALGMDYLTYVQTPILYIATGSALLSGNLMWALAAIGIFNLGRFLPMLVNLLPVSDRAVQRWLARHQEHAVLLDGGLLIMAGAAALFLVLQ